MVPLPDLQEPGIYRLGNHVLSVCLRGLIVYQDHELVPLVRDGIVYLEGVLLYLSASFSIVPHRGHGTIRDLLRGPNRCLLLSNYH